MFRALLLSQDDDGNRTHAITELNDTDLPDRPVIVDVDYSTLNYKDGLAIVNGAPIVRTWPMVPGVDLAGTVASSDDPAWSPGDKVIVNGWDLGESYWGGMATKAALDGGWLTPLPDAYTTHQAMAVGTAGYTAMLCVLALEEHGITPRFRPGGRYRRGGRRGQRGCGRARRAGLRGSGLQRSYRHRGRLPTPTGRGRVDPPRRALRSGPAPRQGPLRRRRRHGGQPHLGQHRLADPAPRVRGRLRAGPGHGFSQLGGPPSSSGP